jgi:hypothetical protein
MHDLPAVRSFRLSRGGIECDEQGLRVGDRALLTRDKEGVWAARDERDLDCDLSRVYGFPVAIRAKMAGFGAVAKALQNGNIAKAQIAALLLQLPDPLSRTDVALAKSAERRLHRDLAACGLLKADDEWDEQHPRTGSPPNAGWFAAKPKDAQADEPPKADARSNQGASSDRGAPGGEIAFLSTTAVRAAESLLAENLPETALKGLATLASRVSAPAIIFGGIFIPSATPSVDEGPVPGRSDMRYRWARAGSEVTFDALIDGQWRRFTTGRLRTDSGFFYDSTGEIVARLVRASGQRPTLVTDVDVLDRALANLHPGAREPDAGPAAEDREPKLCPDPTPEPRTADKSPNSIRYQEYVSKLSYGLAIRVGTVNFDGCDPQTGDLLEAKADIDFMFDKKDDFLQSFVNPKKDPQLQMQRQVEAAKAAGRIVVWHAQSEKGYRGLSKIADHMDELNLFVVHDPN